MAYFKLFAILAMGLLGFAILAGAGAAVIAAGIFLGLFGLVVFIAIMVVKAIWEWISKPSCTPPQ